ncbi:twin transmembrane helix small protein [Legionella taurinensis]|uniref:Twin transmembrane helix small protein n=1 Tax=Legionella taurinensis TaxID=70611 RepID=A0A3A5L446_9GAMM|nr:MULTISPECIES: twin transmembrane helix small protein [Legionella]MDX1837539.1 twin transmembrane helix small protein [Legionella taurinensis]PUT40875.1 twin transmembrane helix small protein [Legionella taurinensis]PUT44296.1 twin transmembrane helix small protein [Legionella taurinensis]PUT47598.1 twin transmembrane helix small protein [Legionella taurinensis]PUT48737.1 twin transmembrane helix small protein [Legionella taurinensis]
MTKVVIILAMLIILISLGSGLFFLIRDEGKTTRTVKALSWRIGLSLALFIFLIVAFSQGWIQPHSV